jgi:hypothetical protein
MILIGENFTIFGKFSGQFPQQKTTEIYPTDHLKPWPSSQIAMAIPR